MFTKKEIKFVSFFNQRCDNIPAAVNFFNEPAAKRNLNNHLRDYAITDFFEKHLKPNYILVWKEIYETAKNDSDPMIELFTEIG